MKEQEFLDALMKEGLVMTDMVDVGDFKDVDWKTAPVWKIFQFCKANKRWLDPGISWWELAALHEAVEKVKGPAVILETGQCWGTTGRYFAVRTIREGGEFHSIELVTRPKFDEAMVEVGLAPFINTIRGHSQKIPWDKLIDILFIDSEHCMSDALGEYMKYRLFLKQGSIVGYHDVCNCWGVARAIEIMQEMDDLELISSTDIGYGAGISMFQVKNMNSAQIRRGIADRDKEIAALKAQGRI